MKVIEHRTVSVSLDDEGFVWFKYKDGAEVSLEDSFDYIKIIEEITEGQKRYFILDSRGVFVQSTNEHRSFMGQNEGALKWRIADAILVDLLPNKILSNSYKSNYSKTHPIAIFKTEEEAKKWLRTHNANF